MEPFPSAAQLIEALTRLDADLVAGFALARDDETRDHLRDRIRRLQARASATAIDHFAAEQQETVETMMTLLHEWAAMLDAVGAESH